MTTVGLLGTIHNAALRERYNCSSEKCDEGLRR
ncbi:hypothetical protein ABIE27_003442 [Paenibacillus sp. 4624]|jgi:hypothetical protein